MANYIRKYSNIFPNRIRSTFSATRGKLRGEIRRRSRNGPLSARHHLHLPRRTFLRVRNFKERFRQKLLELTRASKPRANLMTTQYRSLPASHNCLSTKCEILCRKVPLRGIILTRLINYSNGRLAILFPLTAIKKKKSISRQRNSIE